MSFDIYGNNLRPGHCEVHPHVHEEYPCAVCLSEKKRRTEPQIEDFQAQHIEALQHEIQSLQSQVQSLEQEREADQDAVIRDSFNRGYECAAFGGKTPEQGLADFMAEIGPLQTTPTDSND